MASIRYSFWIVCVHYFQILVNVTWTVHAVLDHENGTIKWRLSIPQKYIYFFWVTVSILNSDKKSFYSWSPPKALYKNKPEKKNNSMKTKNYQKASFTKWHFKKDSLGLLFRSLRSWAVRDVLSERFISLFSDSRQGLAHGSYMQDATYGNKKVPLYW